MSDVAKYIKILAENGGLRMHVCKVDSVTGSTCGVTPISDMAPMQKVRLNAEIENDNGILITPVIGSHVLVCEITEHDAYVAMFSEIEKISIKVGATEVLIKDGEVSFNGGDNGGLVKVSSMVSWMQKVHQDLNTLKLQLSTHPVIGSGNPLGLVFNTQTSYPNKSDFENNKVKH